MIFLEVKPFCESVCPSGGWSVILSFKFTIKGEFTFFLFAIGCLPIRGVKPDGSFHTVLATSMAKNASSSQNLLKLYTKLDVYERYLKQI